MGMRHTFPTWKSVTMQNLKQALALKTFSFVYSCNDFERNKIIDIPKSSKRSAIKMHVLMRQSLVTQAKNN